MADYTAVSVGNTPTLIFSGVGNLLVKTVTENVYIGGSTVSGATDGFYLSISYEPVSINVTSPDEIYAISSSATVATLQVYHNR